MKTKIRNLLTELNKRKGKKEQLEKDLKQAKKLLRLANREVTQHEKAKEIISFVASSMQEKLKYNISDIISLALGAVFIETYELVLDFVDRRNKKECDIYFEKNGNRINPMFASGGGVVDVASFALRIACWALRQKKSINTIILDEPFRYVSQDLRGKASEMLKEISTKLKIQFIIITHDNELTTHADRIFQVSQRKNVSSVKIL